jgi:hypothetical protein
VNYFEGTPSHQRAAGGGAGARGLAGTASASALSARAGWAGLHTAGADVRGLGQLMISKTIRIPKLDLVSRARHPSSCALRRDARLLLGGRRAIQLTPTARGAVPAQPRALARARPLRADGGHGQDRPAGTPADCWAARRRSVAARARRRERQRITDRASPGSRCRPTAVRAAAASGGCTCSTGAARRSRADRRRGAADGSALLARRDQVAFVGRGRAPVAADGAGGSPRTRADPQGARRVAARPGRVRGPGGDGPARGYWWSPDGDLLAFARWTRAGSSASPSPIRPARAPPVGFPIPRPGGPTRGRPGPRGGGRRPPPGSLGSDALPYLAGCCGTRRGAAGAAGADARPARGGAAGGRRGQRRTRRCWSSATSLGEPGRDLPRWLPDGSGLLWASERGGRARSSCAARRRRWRELCGAARRSCRCAPVGPTALGASCCGGPVGNRLERLDCAAGARGR